MDREELRKGRAAVDLGEEQGGWRAEAAEMLKIGRQTRVSQLFI
jgi:hypothetical protein